MNVSVEEFSTPRVDAEGDGIKKTVVKKRIPYPSSRKFNAKTVKDDAAILKLETALNELQRPKVHNCMQKAQTMAEITPSKCRTKKRQAKITSTPLVSSDDRHQIDDVVTLHATPRRPLDGTPTPAPRHCPRERATCDVYRRLLLLCWRRHRALLDASQVQCGRQKDQIHQLELQIDVLKNLRNSESDKRKEAVNECQKLKKAFELLESENLQLIEEIKNMKDALDNTNTNWKLTKSDLKNTTEQLAKAQCMLMKKREEKLDLVNKLTNQEREIYSQNGIIARLEENLRTTALNLQNSEANLKIKQSELEETLENLQIEIDLSSSLKEDINDLQLQRSHLEDRSRILEDQLNEVEVSCECLKEANTSIKNSLSLISLELSEVKSNIWIEKPKYLATKSLTIFHRVVDALIPIYLNTI